MPEFRTLVYCLCILLQSSSWSLGVCDDFAISLDNRLNKILVVYDFIIHNAETKPELITSIAAHSTTVLYIKNANRINPIGVNMLLYSIEESSQKLTIHFELSDRGIYCGFTDASKSESYTLKSQRIVGSGIFYTIED